MITVKLLNRFDVAEVTVHASWWQRLFGREAPKKNAVHDRFGWRWSDTQEPVINSDIVRALDKELKKARGY